MAGVGALLPTLIFVLTSTSNTFSASFEISVRIQRLSTQRGSMLRWTYCELVLVTHEASTAPQKEAFVVLKPCGIAVSPFHIQGSCFMKSFHSLFVFAYSSGRASRSRRPAFFPYSSG